MSLGGSSSGPSRHALHSATEISTFHRTRTQNLQKPFKMTKKRPKSTRTRSVEIGKLESFSCFLNLGWPKVKLGPSRCVRLGEAVWTQCCTPSCTAIRTQNIKTDSTKSPQKYRKSGNPRIFPYKKSSLLSAEAGCYVFAWRVCFRVHRHSVCSSAFRSLLIQVGRNLDPRGDLTNFWHPPGRPKEPMLGPRWRHVAA